jgi:tetratricopeptide (TPR) repeat protein
VKLVKSATPAARPTFASPARRPRRLLAAAAIAAALAAGSVGCESAQKTPKEEAMAKWNAARAGVLYSLASDQYKAGNFDDARKTVGEALKMDPQNARLHVLSAKLAIEQGRLEQAESALANARQCDPLNAEADYLTGVVYQRWQKRDLALQHYEAASLKAPAELAYLLARSETLVELDRSKEALRLLEEKVVYFENSATIRDAVGQLLLQQGRTAEAIEMFRAASVLTPDDDQVREHLALAQFQNKDWRDADRTFGQLLEKKEFENRADLHLAQGECRLQLRRYVDARGSFENVTRLDPSLPGGWLGLAKTAVQMKDERRADLSIRKVLSLQPGSAEGFILLGYLRLNQARWSEAVTAFERASNLDPRDPLALCMTGYAMEKLGRKTDALDYYGRALRLDPKDELAHRLMTAVDTGE